MKTEILLLNLLNNFGAFIHKVKLTKLGTIEVLVNRDISLSGKFNIDRVFYFNFFFSRLIRDLRLFLCCSLADLAIVDYPERKERFVVVYNFLSIRNFFRIFVILKVSSPFLEAQNYNNSQFYIKSLTSLFNGSFWLEREGWDLFGVFFQDNTDLRRILTDYGFEGYPLRKDFPLTGFLEVRYDDEQRSVVYENLELSQEFRFFDFESPWDRQENIVFNNYSN